MSQAGYAVIFINRSTRRRLADQSTRRTVTDSTGRDQQRRPSRLVNPEIICESGRVAEN
jgi:hypothetical protein